MDTVAEDRELQADLLKTSADIFDRALKELMDEVNEKSRESKGLIHWLACERFKRDTIDRLRFEFMERNAAIMEFHRHNSIQAS